MTSFLWGLLVAVLVVSTAAWLFPVANLRMALWLQRRLAGFRTRRIHGAGFDWVYFEGGHGEPIVMIHGFSASKDNWVPFAARLRRRYRIVAPDLPGHGDTGGGEHQRYDVTAQVRYLRAFIDALGLGPVHLVGNSMGGHIAGLYAAQHPDQVRTLAFFDNAGVEPPRKSEFIRRLEETDADDNLLILKSPDDYARMADFLFVDPPYVPAPIRRGLIRHMLDVGDYYRRMFKHLIDGYVPLEPLLPRIRLPVMLLWGDSDRVLDVSSIQVMEPLIADCTTVVMPACGHIPMLERPAEAAGHYQAFLAAAASKHPISGDSAQ